MAVSIHVATGDDLPRIRPVIERAYRGDSARLGWSHEADLLDDMRLEPGELEGIIAAADQRLLIAEQDGAAIGCVQVSDLGKGLAYLGLLCVEPGLQGGGIGKKLMEAAERVAREVFEAKRIEMGVIDVREELIAYYRRRGYAPSGETRPFPVAVDPPLTLSVLVKPLV